MAGARVWHSWLVRVFGTHGWCACLALNAGARVWHSWLVRVFGIPLCSWVSAERTKWNSPPPGNWDQEPQLSRKPEVSSLLDLILVMTILFSDMTLTLHKSRVHCCGVRWVRIVLNWTSLRNT